MNRPKVKSNKITLSTHTTPNLSDTHNSDSCRILKSPRNPNSKEKLLIIQ